MDDPAETDDDEVVRFSLRMPAAEFAALSAAAKDSARSINSEIRFRLLQSLAAELPSTPLIAEIQKLGHVIDQVSKQLGTVSNTVEKARIRLRHIKRRGGLPRAEYGEDSLSGSDEG